MQSYTVSTDSSYSLHSSCLPCSHIREQASTTGGYLMAYSKHYQFSAGRIYTHTLHTTRVRQAPLSQQLRFARHLAHNPSTEQYLIRKGWFHQVVQLRRVRTLVGCLIYLAIVAIVLLTI